MAPKQMHVRVPSMEKMGSFKDEIGGRLSSFSPRHKMPSFKKSPSASGGTLSAGEGPRESSSMFMATTLTVRLERGPGGAFGMSLNDWNRITETDEGGPAEIAKMRPYDRIVKVDGLGAWHAHRCQCPAPLVCVSRAVCDRVSVQSSLASWPIWPRGGMR